MQIHFITLGVSDIQRATDFYADVMGFKVIRKSSNFTLFENGGMRLGLYPFGQLSVLSGSPKEEETHCASGVLLSHNVQNENDVDEWVQKLINEKIKIHKEAQPAIWGGRHAFFSDPDGYRWEICWNPKLIPDAFGNLPTTQ